jgi:XTP/dITP diphosphohydrolase
MISLQSAIYIFPADIQSYNLNLLNSEVMEIFFATGNQGKIEEMTPRFVERGHSLKQVDVDVHELDALDVEEVAKQKVIDSFEAADVNGPMIVEDTGFYVEGIGGFPGSEAAYFDKTAGADKLLDLLKDVDDRSAYFKTTIALIMDGEVHTFSGKMHGRVSEQKRGESHPHLPYDSYFIPEGEERSFAENAELKEAENHREKAVKKFLDWLDN